MKTTFKGKKDQRSCGSCKFCPAGAPKCAWRIGLYNPQMSPLNTGIVLHATRFGGHNGFVAQPLRGNLTEEAAWLAQTAQYNPVVLLNKPLRSGGVVLAVLAANDQIGQEVSDVVGFGAGPTPIVEAVDGALEE